MEKTLLEEIQESINELIKKAKEWFSNVGECDVNLMISCGAITENQIIEMYLKENSFKFLDYDSLLVIESSKENLEKTHELYKQLKEIAMKYKTLIITGEQKKEVKDYDLG